MSSSATPAAPTTTVSASENYQLKWHSFGAHLHSTVAHSLHQSAFTDVTLCTVEGRQVRAHRFVLSASSAYLQRVFKGAATAAQQQPQQLQQLLVVMPPEIDYRTLQTLVQYMYCGETTVSNDILEKVLRGGDLLQVRGLWRPAGGAGGTTAAQPPAGGRAPATTGQINTPVVIVPHAAANHAQVTPRIRNISK